MKPTAQYKHLVLAVRAADFAVTESMVVSKHSSNHFLFTKLEVNTRLTRKRFRFKPPPGTKVINNTATVKKKGRKRGKKRSKRSNPNLGVITTWIAALDDG